MYSWKVIGKAIVGFIGLVLLTLVSDLGPDNALTPLAQVILVAGSTFGIWKFKNQELPTWKGNKPDRITRDERPINLSEQYPNEIQGTGWQFKNDQSS